MPAGESLYSFTTKVNGDLFTIRGNTLQEFHSNVAEVGANLQSLLNDLAVVQAGGQLAPLVNVPAQTAPTPPPAQAQPPAPPQQAQWPQQPPAQQWQQPAPPAQPAQQWPAAQGPVHLCDCGQPMKLRTSQYGSFYSCAKHQQDPSRCGKKVNV